MTKESLQLFEKMSDIQKSVMDYIKEDIKLKRDIKKKEEEILKTLRDIFYSLLVLIFLLFLSLG